MLSKGAPPGIRITQRDIMDSIYGDNNIGESVDERMAFLKEAYNYLTIYCEGIEKLPIEQQKQRQLEALEIAVSSKFT